MIRGKTRPVPQERGLTLDLRASIHNRFDVEVIDAATGKLKQRARGFNVICEGLWDRMFNGRTSGRWEPQDYFNYILFGSGSGTPSSSDTALFSQLGSKQVYGYDNTNNNISFSIDRRAGVAFSQAVVTLEAGEYVGETLTEVGIGYTGAYCATHALLQDMNGNPISIEKTGTDVIKIYATVFAHWPADGWYGGSINIPNYSEDSRGWGFFHLLTGKSWRKNGDISLVSANVRVGWSNGAGPEIEAYPSPSRENKTFTIQYRLQAAAMNIPIMYLGVYSRNNGYFYGVLDVTPGSWFNPPAITGEAVGTGDGSAVGFSTAFPIKSGATVYVDGVAASGVTVRGGPAAASRMEQWFDFLSGSTAAGGALTPNGTPLYSVSNNPVGADYIQIDLTPGASTFAFLNPFSAIGLASFSVWVYSTRNTTVAVQASDDCVTWETALAISNPPSNVYTEYAVPAAFKNKKYWRFRSEGDASLRWYFRASAAVADVAHNIVFDTPPAAGAVITCDYVPDCIAKDSDHVFDLTLVLTLGEYQEA